MPNELLDNRRQLRASGTLGEDDLGRVKRLLLGFAVRAARTCLQSNRLPFGKRFIWERLCVPYLSWRKTEFPFVTRFGARMMGRPCQFVEGRVLFFGVWEPHVTALFESLVCDGDVVLDVGANVGYYTLLSSRLVGPMGRVYSVEPSATTRDRLRRNLAMNAAVNVVVLPIAAWDSGGDAEFHYDVREAGSSSLRTLDCRTVSEQVQLSRLDDLISENDSARISLIKLDIEGAELHALRGLSRIIDANPRLTVIAEVDPQMLDGLGSSADELLQFLFERGFRAASVPNVYDVSAYLAPAATFPRNAIHGPIRAPSYVCFSRDSSRAVPESDSHNRYRRELLP